jgi:L-amino acid N-acyltransferase YncA
MKKHPVVEIYEPRESVLVNGEKVCFRPMDPSHEEGLNTFFGGIPDKEAESLRDNVKSPDTIAAWIRTMDFGRVFPLLATSETSRHIVAASSLHFQGGVYRHIAELRIVVGLQYRKLGLGSALIKELIEVANRSGLHFMKAEIPVENQLAIRAFRQLGFELKCTLERYFMTRAGDTSDVAFMMKRLLVEMEEDFFYIF